MNGGYRRAVLVGVISRFIRVLLGLTLPCLRNSAKMRELTPINTTRRINTLQQIALLNFNVSRRAIPV